MNDILIVFASATTVSRIKKGLRAKKFRASLRQTPQHLMADGCSYAVVTQRDALSYVKELSGKLGVRIKAVYEIHGEDYRLLETRF